MGATATVGRTVKPRILTIREAAEELRVHEQTAYKWAREGKLASLKINNKRYVPAAALEKLLTVPQDR